MKELEQRYKDAIDHLGNSGQEILELTLRDYIAHSQDDIAKAAREAAIELLVKNYAEGEFKGYDAELLRRRIYQENKLLIENQLIKDMQVNIGELIAENAELREENKFLRRQLRLVT